MDPLGGEESPWADAPAQPPPSSTSEPGAAATDKPTDAAPSSSTAAGASSSGPRPSRLTPRRLVAQPTKLQAVEDDPLGPLGAGASDDAAAASAGGAALPLAPGAEGAPPMPPQKEQPAAMASTLPMRTTMGGQAARRGAPADPHRVEDEEDPDGDRTGGRAPPPVQAAQPVAGAARGMGPPSVSIEQAAKPSFTITVGDPHKVGDLTSSHIVYSVRTVVCSVLALYTFSWRGWRHWC